MRYIGNKCKLLKEINNLLGTKGLKIQGLTFCDIFSGTATVANNYNGFYEIIANDFLDYAFYFASGLLLFNNSSFKGLGFDPFDYFNNADTSNYCSGFCYNNFAPFGGCMYFSDDNAKFIDFIRDTIDIWYNENKITLNEKQYLICCLLEAVSKVSNVAGVYSAFLRIWDPRAIKRMIYQPIEVKASSYINKVYCEDANELINKISGDILYIDPPYTTTQYNSQYHVLETIARNDNPITHGVGKHRQNDRLSNWCKKGVVEYWFEHLIKNAKFKHIIFSYSDKGIMSLKFIEAVLKRYAKAGTYSLKKINFVKYKNTRAVNREKLLKNENSKHYEYLFYIEKSDDIKYVSPLNYIGGKYETLPLLMAYFPNSINKFYDLFGGGATVSINAPAQSIIYNDINNYVVDLLKYLSKTKPYKVYAKIMALIKKYGLAKANKEAYISLRRNYNITRDCCMLYLLICYGFEHQIRFNSNHDFNNPCGNSGFNDELYEKLISFYLRVNSIDISFNSNSFNYCINDITKNDFVYLDPPYLNNLGVYNDGKRGFNGWDKQQEKQLYEFIELLNSRGIKFMLSNYTSHKNDDNDSLIDWANSNGFKIIIDDKITVRNRQNRRELIIINY